MKSNRPSLVWLTWTHRKDPLRNRIARTKGCYRCDKGIRWTVISFGMTQPVSFALDPDAESNCARDKESSLKDVLTLCQP